MSNAKANVFPKTATASLMRSINRTLILDLIRHEAPISRSKIARELNLSLPTVMRVVDDLIEEGFVQILDTLESTGGRPRPLIAFNGKAYTAVGIDLGGTKMFGAVADLEGSILHEVNVPWKEADSEDSLEELYKLIRELLDVPREPEQQMRGIGVGAPGVTQSQEGIVTWAPSLGWRNLPLKQILSDRFDVPVYVDNDVNLSALGELGFGAGRGVQNLVCIAVGTGIGAGIIIGGSLYRGHTHSAGELGHMLPGIEFLRQRYDRFGALEGLASGTGIVERARQLLQKQGRELPLEAESAQTVFEAARGGEAWARQVVDETVDYLALAIANVSTLLDPEVVVLGGGVGGSADLLIEPILERLNGRITCVPKLVASPLGRRAAAMGAIMLVLNATSEHFVVTRIR